MRELKTLKDMRQVVGDCYGGHDEIVINDYDEESLTYKEYHKGAIKKGDLKLMCYEDDLKQEAIKHIKDAQDKIFRLEERATKGLSINKLEIWENIGKSNVLMDFFNITEEDLK